jgi:hypothetical protein
MLGGRGLPLARELRVRIEDDDLVVVQPGGHRRRLAGTGDITRVIYLEAAQARRLLSRGRGADRDVRRADQGGALVLLAGAVPVLTVLLLEWAPPTPLDGSDLRAACGITALTTSALGLPAEPAEPADLTALEEHREMLQRTLLRGAPERPAPGRWAPVQAGVAIAVGFLGWPLGGTPAGAACALVGLVLATPLVMAVTRGRAEAAACAAEVAGPRAAGASVVVPARPAGRVPAQATAARLELGPADVVLVDRSREVWLPGPRAGGVASVTAAPDAVVLSDAGGLALAVTDAALWCPEPVALGAFRRDCESGGLSFAEQPFEANTFHLGGTLGEAAIAPSLLLTDAERGDPTTGTPWLAGLASGTALVAGLFALAWVPAAGAVLSLAGAALSAASVRNAIRRRAADRAAVRLVDAGCRDG